MKMIVVKVNISKMIRDCFVLFFARTIVPLKWIISRYVTDLEEFCRKWNNFLTLNLWKSHPNTYIPFGKSLFIPICGKTVAFLIYWRGQNFELCYPFPHILYEMTIYWFFFFIVFTKYLIPDTPYQTNILLWSIIGKHIFIS